MGRRLKKRKQKQKNASNKKRSRKISKATRKRRVTVKKRNKLKLKKARRTSARQIRRKHPYRLRSRNKIRSRYRLRSSSKKRRRSRSRSRNKKKHPYRLRSRNKKGHRYRLRSKNKRKSNKRKKTIRTKRKKAKKAPRIKLPPRYEGELHQANMKINQQLARMRFLKHLCDTFEAQGVKKDREDFEKARDDLEWSNLRFRKVMVECSKINKEHKMLPYSTKGINWEEIFCGRCLKNDEREVLLCDGPCHRAYHLGCLEPPLTEVPEDEDWFCPQCEILLSGMQALGDIYGKEIPLHSYNELQALFPLLTIFGCNTTDPIGTKIIYKNGKHERYGTVVEFKKDRYKIKDADDGRRKFHLTRHQLNYECKLEMKRALVEFLPEDEEDDDSYEPDQDEEEEAKNEDNEDKLEEENETRRRGRGYVNYRKMAGVLGSDDWGSDPEEWADESESSEEGGETYSDDSDDWTDNEYSNDSNESGDDHINTNSNDSNESGDDHINTNSNESNESSEDEVNEDSS